MEEKKTTYMEEQKTYGQNNMDLAEAADLFSRLSPELQDVIIELLHSIVDKN